MKFFKSAEKTGVQSGSPWSLFGWASGVGAAIPGIGSLFKAMRGSGAADGQSPYDQTFELPGSVTLGSFESALAASNVLLPFTLPRYRVMSAHPTLALAEMSLVLTILAAETSVHVDEDLADDAVAQKGKAILEKEIIARRQAIMRGCLQSLRYGWKSFENVFEKKTDATIGDYVGLQKFKQLAGDYITFDVDKGGNLLAVRSNGVPLEAPYFTHIVHDKEDDNWFGRSRHENARRHWANGLRVEDLLVLLTDKVTGKAPYVGVPPDDPDRPDKEKTPNLDMGKAVANALFNGKPVVYTNTAGIDSQDLRTNPNLAAGKLVDVEFLDIGNPGPAIQSLIAYLAVVDKMLVRAWLRPERATLESQGGASRADSESHGDMTIADAETTHESIVEQLNDQPVASLVRENCGEQYVGRIKLIALPLQDETREVWSKFLDKLCDDPAFVAGVIKMLGSAGVEEVLKKNGIDLKVDASAFDYEPADKPASAGPSVQTRTGDDEPANLSSFDIDDLHDLLPLSGAQDEPRDSRGRWVNVSGEELGEHNSDDAVREAAKAHAKQHLIGKTFTNEDKGWPITISGASVRKIIANTGDIRRAHMVAAIPDLIRTATWKSVENAKGVANNVVAFHRFEANVKYKGSPEKVNFVVRQQTDGNWYYNHGFGEVK